MPELDYGFEGWTGDKGGNQDPFYLTLWDGDVSVFANFVITATGYWRWLFDHFSDEERADDAISGFAVDTDKDGRINLLEYVGNTDPKVEDPQPFYEYDLIEKEGESYLLISYTAETQLDELDTYVEFSADMLTWSSNEDGGDIFTELYDSLDNEDGTETLFHKLLTPLSDGERKFLRVRFVEE
ncbi:MAG: hypothetical protein P8L44_07065 [Opitutales bacterium]|nr:hypothetical protein [Opitutales bacterium]